jgi:hypothetical protein
VFVSIAVLTALVLVIVSLTWIRFEMPLGVSFKKGSLYSEICY